MNVFVMPSYSQVMVMDANNIYLVMSVAYSAVDFWTKMRFVVIFCNGGIAHLAQLHDLIVERHKGA